MSRTKLNYKPGTWFAVPLRTDGYTVGLVARLNGRGIVLGYFFNLNFPTIPSKTKIPCLLRSDAILVRLFGDLGLLNGNWPIIYNQDDFDLEEWPLPLFARISDKGKALGITHSASTLSSIKEEPISLEQAKNLPKDGLSGYGAVEITLSKLLQ